MIPYSAPTRDMQFLFDEMGLLGQLQALPGGEETTSELLGQILDEANKLASNVLAPLNYSGDKQGAQIENGVVRTPDGWKDAYRHYVEGGWNSVPFDPDFGGQGLPWAITTAVQEMFESANMAWALCPLLTQGAVEAISAHASDELKGIYLEKMVSGEWTGTMNLTEPQAGSDLSLVKTKAERDGDRYRIRGQKIFITYGEHDMTDNIVHLVLARLPDAPAGTRGISLFLVPKFLVNEDGSLGARNDLRCVSLEHKLGIGASPTCVMAYGDNEGAIGYLVGEENRGLECMFTMMNNARLAVGMQGLAIAERAYQQARDFAKERKQGKSASSDGAPAPIIHHADVRRMLLTMRAHTEAMRALILDTMTMLDISHRHTDESWRGWASKRVDLLTPVIKGWFTDTGVEMASLGVQVHGGMGFIEETGAAQHYRDARILPIYEGTNGIQAADLIGRKILRDGGDAVHEYIDELHSVVNGLADVEDEAVAIIRRNLAAAVDTLEQATEWLLTDGAKSPDAAHASSTLYMRLFGQTAGGAMMARVAKTAVEKRSAANGDGAFYDTKLLVARFYAENILPLTAGLLGPIIGGHATVMALEEELF
ncbi:acyl-CoA dehydrogenase C-terminal domain-containing protein [Hwanghaeella sp.]|uniref:acyl-CoA dehydrogenase C-terminal domain-containing protein n=1 Tax=Hwanghaeella sp. TaxID=2605943 RepID=UPI003CCC158E